MVFPVVMYGCESWTIKKAECRRIDAFQLWCWRRLLSPLDCKEIKPVNPKGNQPWIFIGRTDAETEAPILWPPDVKSRLIGKNPDAGKDWRQEEKGTTEDEMVGFNDSLIPLTSLILLIQWTWVRASSRRCWRTGKPGMLQSMGLQRVGTRLSYWTTTKEGFWLVEQCQTLGLHIWDSLGLLLIVMLQPFYHDKLMSK